MLEENRTIIREDFDYHHTLMEGMFLSFKEAADDGLLSEYEDLIDALYASIPTKKKMDIKVFDEEGKKENCSIDEWKKAMSIKPPDDLPSSKKDRHPDHKKRALRKTQILTDIEHALGFLMKEPPVGKMGTHKTFYKRMAEGDE
jgi:hypothetical protein